MHVANSPCTSCPYRKDVPSGVWHKSEYEKLREYDEPPRGSSEIPATALFLCHQTPEIGQQTACRGWLTVHCESVAVRLAVLKGDVTPEQVYAEVKEPLYKSGNEAADAGIKQIKRPGKKARKIVARLAGKGGRRLD